MNWYIVFSIVATFVGVGHQFFLAPLLSGAGISYVVQNFGLNAAACTMIEELQACESALTLFYVFLPLTEMQKLFYINKVVYCTLLVPRLQIDKLGHLLWTVTMFQLTKIMSLHLTPLHRK